MQCPRTPRLPSDSNDQWNVTKPFEIDADGALTQTGSHMIAMHIDMMSANMPDHSLFLQLPCYCSVFERMENPPRMPLPNRSYTVSARLPKAKVMAISFSERTACATSADPIINGAGSNE